MEPFDMLTQEDQKTILDYVKTNARGVPADCYSILHTWNKNKRTLFKALGKQLRVKVPITIERNRIIFNQQLAAIYTPYVMRIWDVQEELGHAVVEDYEFLLKKTKNEFIAKAMMHAYAFFKGDEQFCAFTRLFGYTHVRNGVISLSSYSSYPTLEFPSINITIKNGMKVAKAVQKVLKAIDFPHMDLFEKWRNQISDLNANRSFSTNLVISIHPIDFMTMSDNNCDWSSCMSWTKDGMYSASSIEMLNSNVAVIAYLESKTPYENSGHQIPNKSWRLICYAHKDILLSGKQYPYSHEELTHTTLREIANLLKKNLNWSYQYGIQQYQDIIHYHSNEYLRHQIPRRKKIDKHNIIVYTRTMYNDLVQDTDTKYWCYRNYVEKPLFLCLSGSATCMCCGDKLYPDDGGHYDNYGSNKICRNCLNNFVCYSCGKVIHPDNDAVVHEIKWLGPHSWYNEQHICHDCLTNDFVYVPSLDRYLPISSINTKYKRDYCIVTEEDMVKFKETYGRSSYFSYDEIQELLDEAHIPYRRVPMTTLYTGDFDVLYTYERILELDPACTREAIDHFSWVPAKEVVSGETSCTVQIVQ